MEIDDEDKIYSAYKVLWTKKIPDLVSVIENKEINSSTPLLKFQGTNTPLPNKVEIVIYNNGELVVSKRTGILNHNTEVDLHAWIKEELLLEIKRLLNQKTLQNHKSCYKNARDGYRSMLTLYTKDKVRVISNENCKMREFSLSYRKLILLLHSLLKITEW